MELVVGATYRSPRFGRYIRLLSSVKYDSKTDLFVLDIAWIDKYNSDDTESDTLKVSPEETLHWTRIDNV